MNYFEIFDLKINTQIDLDQLEEKYLTFQQQFHPDKASTADIEKSILLNEAFEVLKTTFSRLSYILKLQGTDILDDTKAPKVDNETLQEIWELQEELLESSQDEKIKLKKELKNKVSNLLTQSAEEINNKNFTKAAQILIRSKYFNKILQSLKSV